jgi:hypothetical protein
LPNNLNEVIAISIFGYRNIQLYLNMNPDFFPPLEEDIRARQNIDISFVAPIATLWHLPI